ncbi:hypothetical protein MN116_000801, partial [Schistosoma mekongi]
MITKMNMINLIYLIGIFVHLLNAQKICPSVNYITPNEASTEGGSAIMIFGCGFEQSAFVLPGSNTNSGNRVYLKSAWQTYTAELVEEGENMLKFSSPKLPEDSYSIVVTVSGVFIPPARMCLGYACILTVKSSVTPTIEKISPIYAPPGSVIGMNGTIFTSRFSSNLDVFTVGKSQSIVSYGIALLSPTSDKGYIMCKRNVSQIGSVNISFIVDSPYGRSRVIESAYRVDRNEQTFMHQSYSVIQNVTSIHTSSSGGGSIEIIGDYLKPQSDVTITVGNTKCLPTLINSTYIQCILDGIGQASKPMFYPGNRGLIVQFWPNLTTTNVNDLLAMNFEQNTQSSVKEVYLFEPDFIPNSLFNGTGVIRLTMIFVPPKSSYYQFIVTSANIYALLGGKMNETPTQMTVVNSRTKSIYLRENEDTISQPTAVIRLCASLLNTSINSQQLKASKPTSYLISIKSNISTERQIVDHSALVSSLITPISEVQTIFIPIAATQYKLCLFDSCTLPLPVQNPNVATINTELNEKFNSSTVITKIKQTTNDYLVLEITFPNEFGDLPLLNVQTIPDTINKPQVNEIVKGMTGIFNTIRPSYGGMYSYVTYKLASTENEIRSAYLNLGSSWCPSKLTNPLIKYAILDDFETSTLKEVTTETIAFCGRQCALNLFTYQFSQLVSVNTNPYLCFAIKGKTKDTLNFTYNAFGLTTRLLKQTFTYTTDLTLPDENSWKFKCFNVLQLLRLDPRNVNATLFQLESFSIEPRKKFYELEYSLYLDTVYMGTKPIFDNPDDVATWPRFPKDLFSEIIVKKDSTIGVFTVEIITKSCRNSFQLFGITGINIPIDNKTIGQTVILRDERWPTSVHSSITRNQLASPPIDGSFVLSFKGVTTSRIPAKYIDPSIIERLLNLHPLMGSVRVIRSGWCSNFQYNVWLDSLPGDQPELIIMNGTKLIGDATQITVQKSNIGELVMCPISSDMIATKHSVPQVRLYVDNFPAYCNTSCDHQFTDLLSPVVSSSQVQIIDKKLTLILSGNDFIADSPNSYELYLMFNEEIVLKQQPFRTTTTELYFFNQYVSSIPCGLLTGRLRLTDKGFTKYTTDIQLGSEGSEIKDVLQTGIFEYGNEYLRIIGSRFLPSHTFVYFDDVPCTIINMTTTEIICLLPITQLSGKKLVSVVQHGNNISRIEDFTTKQANGPVITSVVQTKVASVSGTTQIIINGAGFTPTMLIFIGGVKVENFTFINQTQIILLAPPQKVNGEKVILLFDANNAIINSGFSVTYKFEINDVKPQIGSFVGGQIVNIFGEGFDNDIRVYMQPVTVDNQLCNDRPRAECQILFKNSTTVQCRTTSLVKKHYILDNGIDTIHGLGYQWQPKTLTIIQGDSVIWIWNTTTRTNPLMIAEVSSLSDITPSEYGFHSGQPTQNGAYVFNFTRPGTYYYTSSTTFLMMGIIEVKAFDDCMTEVVVETDYSTAVHTNVPDTVSWDPLITCGTGFNCETLKKSSELTAKHSFVYRGCATPIVYSFSPFNIYSGSKIVVTSHVLATCVNELDINVGGAYCTSPVQGINDSESIECTLEEEQVVSAGILTGQMLRPCISHRNLGHALLEVSTNEFEQYAFFWPQINCDKTYGIGSIYGGSQLIVYGTGFDPIYNDLNKVTLSNGQNCMIREVTSGYIKCFVPKQDVLINDKVLNVTIEVQTKSRNQDNWIDAQHSSHTDCIYSYSINATPVIKQINPHEINANQTLIIRGSNLMFPNENITHIKIQLDGIACVVDPLLSSIDTLSCQINGSLPAGYVTFSLFDELYGYPKYETNVTLISQTTLYSLNPSKGSFAGGTIIQINGNGMNDPTLKIYINSNECQIINDNRSVNQVFCRTPAIQNYSTLQDYQVSVNLSTGASIPNGYTYANMQTPIVFNATVNPIIINETLINEVKIYGNKLNGDTTHSKTTEIRLNQKMCELKTIQNDYIQCYVINLPSDVYQLIVDTPVYGYAISNVSIDIKFSLKSISPSSGGIGGGQLVEIQGTGMDVEKSTVLICNQLCAIVGGSSLALRCVTPKSTTINPTVCDVTVAVPNSLQATLTAAFEYDSNLSPRIIDVYPLIGGTGGGTNLTIIGNLFDNSTTVNIGGSNCQVISFNDSVIICQTSEHNQSEKVPIEVTVENIGKASGSFTYYYVDRWSSQFTWNNQPIPVENDFVVINQNQNVMLDTDTPILSMLLINGGTLFFDPTKDIQLHSKYILIVNDGKFLIGSPTEPYTKQAKITLHGHVREKELPLYGAKVLALRNGTISIHGKPRLITWTRLAKTAEAGSKILELEHSVDWQPGEHIIITSTGGKASHNESEEHVIKDISSDNRVITLMVPLTYKKLSIKKTYSNGVIGNFAAEVGLLSRNILIRGTEEPIVSSDVQQCPSDFSTDRFATHTCTIGSPDEQLGANEYGGHVHIGGPFVNSGAVKAYLSYTEFYFMGQAYRLGRYPIHFHLNGLMNGSYVRGCSIHKSFNRAINIHNTHEVLVENNVVYDIMGGALFLEDGIEHGNLIQYNLFIHVKRTSSLLNDDVVPAAFWITQPNNTVRHNVAASGTHFGFWYRMLENPSGPSTTTSVCPRRIPLGIFENNTVHSQGWFALWIHESFFPTKTGTCGSTTWVNAVFQKLTAWNNNKGPECVNCGGVQFENMLLVNNDEAAIEGKRLMSGNLYNPTTGPLYGNSTIVAYEPDLVNGNPECHTRAVNLPWSPGLTIENMVMKNFNGQNCTAIHGTVITCLCNKLCGGYEYLFKNIQWEDTNNRAEFRWHGDFSLRDVDGSLTDGIPGVPKLPGSLVVGKANHLPTDKCGPTAPGAGDLGSAFGQGAVQGVRCLPEVTALRFALDQTNPAGLMGSNMTVTLLDGGTEEVPFKTEALTDKKGWMTTLVNNRTYIVNWKSISTFINLSYIGFLENFRQSDYVIIRHTGIDIKPDRVQVLQNQIPKQPITDPLDPSVHSNGEVFYNETGKYIEYLVKAPVKPSLFNSYRLWVSFYKCFYTDCIVPTESSLSVLDTLRPSNALYWSNNNTWGDILGPLPKNGSSLTIPKGTWLVLDTSINITMNNITIYGTFEIDSGTIQDKRVYKLAFRQMLIIGGQFLAGPLPEKPLTNATLELTLLGSMSDEFINVDGPVIGPKSIGIYGAMSMHAKPITMMWTKLRITANAGENKLYLIDPVIDWLSGDRIVIATTSMNYKQSEVHQIASVSSDGLIITLSKNLIYTHVAYNQTYGNHRFITGAEVGLLKSNIIIQSDDQSIQNKFGGRILVSQTLHENNILYGQLKLSGVYFYRMGQQQFSTVTDARFPVAFISAGDVNNVSYIKSCIFEQSLSTAVGGFATTGLLIENNIFYQTYAIWLQNEGHKLIHNLLIESIWSGESAVDNQNLGILFEAALNIKEASDLILKDNSIAGAERLCVYTQGNPCDKSSKAIWEKNTVHSCFIGIMQLSTQYTCTVISNAQIYSVSQFSVYWKTDSAIQADNLQLVDNAGGLYPFVGLPSGRTHEISNKTFQFSNSLLVGRSGIQACDDSPNENAIILGSKLIGPTSPDGSHLGMTSAQFMSSVGEPQKGKLTDWMEDFANGGAGYLSNLTIANFGAICNGKRDYVWRTSTHNEDGVFPTYFMGTKVISVDLDSTVYYDRPNLANVRFDRCNDMECDGLKKVLVIDKDGGLFGQPTVIIPQSEWQYNLNSNYGVGDKRIPSRMLINVDGSSIDPMKQWPNKGSIIRDSSCIYMPKMQAYKCSKQLDHNLLLIESMDVDSLERRLSPIAFATEGLSANYIDLINGPSDHGVCSSYACLKRMSTYMAIVANQKNFIMYMTSTPPQEIRLRLPNAESDYAIRLGIDYFTSGRLDVYVNGVYTKAKNAIINNLGQTVLQSPKTPGEFMPDVMTDPVGTNYFNESLQMLYLIIKGDAIITVKLSQLVKVAFGLPAMSIEQFYGSDVVSNLANFLGIPAKNIRIVKVVSESSTNAGRRRRRSISGIFVELEISSPPVENLTNTIEPNITSGMTHAEMISSKVIDSVQTRLFEQVINATVVGITIKEPTPLPGSILWAAQVSDPANTQQNFEIVQIPENSKIKLIIPTGYASIVEGVPFQVEVSTTDSSGNLVKPLGSNTSSWAYELLQPDSVSPVKVSKTNFPDPATGTALISNLIFTEAGQSNLFVSVISPDESIRLNTSTTVTVKTRQLSLSLRPVQSNSDDSIIKSFIGQNFSVQVNIIDKQTGASTDNINWRNLIWNFTGDICSNSRKPKDILTTSPSTLLYDSSKTNNGFIWTINGFQTSWVYTYCISAIAYLNDSTTRQSQYDLSLTKIRIQVNPQNYIEPSRNAKKQFRFKVSGSYANMLQYIDEFKAAIQSELLTRFPNVLFENITFSEGSIAVDLVASSGTISVVETALNSFTSALNDGNVAFSVGGVSYTATSDTKNAGN